MVKIQVEQGWLEGEVLDLVTGDGTYYSFKGIPYAQPPVGKLRFKAPRPPLPWGGIKSATQHGPICPQYDHFFNKLYEGNEDCLYLNVYTSEINPKQLLPVMFFIHGGGFRRGSGDIDELGPDFLVQQDVVLVTINYRLEVFGFLCLDTKEVPGNAGLKDQNAALKWVKQNISNFGGDPNNITVFGESAGGSSVAFHAISPMSKGLFQKAIAMSGVPFCSWSKTYEPKRRAFALGKQLGIVTNDTRELLEKLQNVPANRLVKSNPNIFGFETAFANAFKFVYFGPVIEKDVGQESFISEDPEECLKKQKINNLDIMLGFTNQEALFKIHHFSQLMPKYNQYNELMVPTEIFMKIKPESVLNISDKIKNHYFGDKILSEDNTKEFVSFISDTGFKYSILQFAKLLPYDNKRRYFYQFSCESERNVFGKAGHKYGIHGASHLDDLCYVFDPKMHNLPLDKTSVSYRMIMQTCTLFANFAKYGNPTPDDAFGVIWPEYDNVNQYYMDISNTLTIGKELGAEITKFWDSIYEEAKKI